MMIREREEDVESAKPFPRFEQSFLSGGERGPRYLSGMADVDECIEG